MTSACNSMPVQSTTGNRIQAWLKAAAVFFSLATLAGCASFSKDGGFSTVQDTARERMGKEVQWVKTDEQRQTLNDRLAELLSRPLTVEDAVQVALLNNRGLQATFAELAISESDLVQAGRLSNPTFSMLRASKSEASGQEFKIEQALTFNILKLALIPQLTEIERRRFDRTRRMASLEVLRLAAETRKAYYAAVASQQTARYAGQVMQTAEASAELARRMARVGNWSKLNQAREQGFYADAALGLARAKQSAVSARENLIRLMSLWGQQTAFTLLERLPDLPASANALADIEQLAMAQRIDLQAARLNTEAVAKNLGLTRTTRFINALEFGPARVLEGSADSAYKTGYEVSFQLPLFDWGGAKVAKAEALYMQAVNVAAQTAIEARSEVREAYQGYNSKFDIARHFRDEVVPIKRRISEENLLRYNGMLIGVFDLLADARSQIASVNGSIEALRDFWIAQADLEMSLIGKPLPTSLPTSAGPVADAPAH
jgi:outer membrane protein TolC